MARSFAFPNYESGVTPATLTGITQANLDGFSRLEYKVKDSYTNGSDYFIVGYWETGTITLSNYNAFPIGSIIWDYVGFTLNTKTGATTWKSETLS